MSTGSWRVASRLARREVRRHPWRHLLVVGLIAVPVLAVFATFSLLGTWSDIEAGKRAYWLADRDAAYGVEGDVLRGEAVPGSVATGDPSRLPEGAVLELSHHGADWFVTDRQRAAGAGPELVGAEVLDAPEGSRRSARVVIDQGRLPIGDDEVLLTRSLAAAGPWEIGDEVESARTGQRFEVVGLGVLGDRTDAAAAVAGAVPEAYWSERAGAVSSLRTASGDQVGLAPSAEVSVWLDGPTSADTLLGAGAEPMAPPKSVDERVRPGIVLGAAAVCAVAATVASAAFALASRHQLRSIGLLSSVGTDPATLRRLLMIQGAAPGLAAGVLAVGLGVGGAVGANRMGIPEELTEVAGAAVTLSWGGAVLAVVLATASGIAAAWVPARTASRVPVLSALGGRRPVGPLPRRVPVGGLVLWTAGALLLIAGVRAERVDPGVWASPFALIIGVGCFAFGAIAIAPLLVVGLGVLAGRTRGMSRLALRGITRQRAQSAAAIAAVGVALALPVGFLTAQTADASDEPEIHVLDQGPGVFDLPMPTSAFKDEVTVVRLSGDLRPASVDEVTAEATAVLGPDARVVDTVLLADDEGAYWLVTAIPEAVAGEVLEPWAATAITDGALVRTNAGAPGGGPVVLRYGEAALPLPVATAPEANVEAPGLPGGYLVSREVLGEFGAGRPISGRAIVRPGVATPEEVDALLGLDPSASYWGDEWVPTLEAIRSAPDRFDPSQSDPTTWLEIVTDGTPEPARAPQGVPPPDVSDPRDEAARRILLWLTAASALVACAVLTVTLSLRAYDGRDDARAALAAGASPTRLRSLRAIEGVVLAVTGAALALPLGWGAVNALLLGQVRRTSEAPGLLEATFGQLASPGWIAVPVVLLPAAAAGTMWTVIPAARARLAQRRGPTDVLAPRW